MRKNALSVCLVVVVAAGLFFAGYLSAQSRVGTPSTIIHHVALKWKPEATAEQKQKVFDDLKALLAEVPGVRNLWIKTVKVQPGDYSQTFVIEFENEAALKAYASHPKKKAWNDFYYSIRQESRNCVTTN